MDSYVLAEILGYKGSYRDSREQQQCDLTYRKSKPEELKKILYFYQAEWETSGRD